MAYRLMGRLHAALLATHSDAGQGTVEYVGLLMLVAVLLTAVIVAAHKAKDQGIPEAIVKKLKEAIDGVGAKSGS